MTSKTRYSYIKSAIPTACGEDPKCKWSKHKGVGYLWKGLGVTTNIYNPNFILDVLYKGQHLS